VILTFNSVDMLREHLRQDVRIHAIITKGGDRVNVVPDLAQAEFAVRAMDTATMEETYKKVVNCARGAELATGAMLDFKEPRSFVKAPISVSPLNRLVAEKLKALGVQEKDIKSKEDFCSSDFGNVAHAYPTVNVVFKIAPDGTAGHSDAMREAPASEEGWKATVVTAKSLALTAYDLLTIPPRRKRFRINSKDSRPRKEDRGWF
jgi:metal-dependent amidase/aminoacylase/carboxypeptidase family protein